MSIQALSEAITDLPYALSEQVLSYARSLDVAAPDIFKDAGVRFSRELADTLVFVAGLRKLLSIVDSNYWVIDNAGAILDRQQGQSSVRVGGTDLSRGSDYHQALATVRKELVELLSEHQLLQFTQKVPYVDVVRELANGR
ncbi:MAG: hypothetical protein K8F33_03480 [Thermomonas sp.]|uniref:hypothetical protein n=1 Tax=Thermomonas sp. TaxID=1971895 RepID=UPI001D55D48E|nr:hypothetical protein [Thermomonas sp.]MBZ0087146.1 hypothetical protein [Thermomonas sp.]